MVTDHSQSQLSSDLVTQWSKKKKNYIVVITDETQEYQKCADV